LNHTGANCSVLKPPAFMVLQKLKISGKAEWLKDQQSEFDGK